MMNKIQKMVVELLTLGRVMADWHVCDGDECGEIARQYIAKFDCPAENNVDINPSDS